MTVSQPMPDDPREQPVIDPWHATPASIAHAKACAAMERALAADAMKGQQERAARCIIERLVQEFGAIYTIALVQSVADRLEAEGQAK